MLTTFKAKEGFPLGGMILVWAFTFLSATLLFKIDSEPRYFGGPSYTFLFALFPLAWGFYALARRRFRTCPSMIRPSFVVFMISIWGASHYGVHQYYTNLAIRAVDELSPARRFLILEEYEEEDRTKEQNLLVTEVHARREAEKASKSKVAWQVQYFPPLPEPIAGLRESEIAQLDAVFTDHLEARKELGTFLGYLRLRGHGMVVLGKSDLPVWGSLLLALGWGLEVFAAVFFVRAFVGRIHSRPFAREASKPYILLDLGPVKTLSAAKAREAIQAKDQALLTFPDEMLDPDDSDEIRVQVAEATDQGDPPLLRFNRVAGVGKKGDLRLEALSPWFEVTPKEVEAIRTRLLDLKRSKTDMG